MMLGERGQMLGLDRAFCAMMRADPKTMIGRGVLDITFPDDREPCRAGMSRLRRTGEPFAIRKRMQRADGSVLWVEQVTALVEFPELPPAIVATFRQIGRPAERIEPAALLDQARFLRESAADRQNALGSASLANLPWDVLLKTYIAEAEGRTVDIVEIARTSRVAPAVALRWARALASQGLLEIEDGADDGPAPVYRLTSMSHARLESYLSQRLRKLIDLSVMHFS